MPTLTELLGTARTTARTSIEISAATVPISKTKRADLSDTERARFYSSAVAGLETKFMLMAPIDGTEELGSVYSLAIRSNEFKKALMMLQMDDVFNILPIGTNGKPTADEIKNLFDSYKDVTLDDVRKSSKYYYEYGENYHVQNLRWSMEKLMNSCDTDLKEKIAERSLNLPLEEHGGPTFFKIMMDTISSVTDRSLRAIIIRVETMTLQDFPGESVPKAASYLRGAIKTLENCGFLPNDIDQVICRIFKTASTEDFRSHIKHIYSMTSLGEKRLSAEEILAEAEKEYYTLVRSGGWDADSISRKGVFQSELKRNNQKRDVTCFNCGKKGHYSRDCRSPKNAGAGRGRHDKRHTKEKNHKKIPPKKGEPRERTGSDGKTEYWDGRLGEWTERKPPAEKDRNENNSRAGHSTAVTSTTLQHLARTGI